MGETNEPKLARRRGLWLGDIAAVVPIAFSTEYRPRSRFLTRDELGKLLATLKPDRAARVAFIVATSACWKESEARREDVALDLAKVLLRGKRATRFRTVPMVTEEQKTLLAFALRFADGDGEMLFKPWGNNVRRDLHAACERAGITHCSPNDLRRTFGTWMRADGVPPHLIGTMMGHADSRMVERVYGRLPVHDLGAAVAAALGMPAPSFPSVPHDRNGAHDCITGASDSAESPGLGGLRGQTDGRQTTGFPSGRVLGPGIEPGTRGFSIRCSTS